MVAVVMYVLGTMFLFLNIVMHKKILAWLAIGHYAVGLVFVWLYTFGVV